MSQPSTALPPARQGIVAALQWGLVQASLVGAFGDFVGGYYELTTSVDVPRPSWVTSIVWAAPVVFLVGAYGGYTWVTNGYASTTDEAHRTRVRFLVALVVLWVGHFVPELLVVLALESPLAVAVVPPVSTLLVVGGAYLLAYRVDPAVFGRVRERLAPTGREV